MKICKFYHIKMNRMFKFPLTSTPAIFLLVSFLLVFLIPNVKSGGEPLLELCSNTYDYASGSQFEANLYLFLQSLIPNVGLNGYFNTSVGEGPDIFYGLAQCRDDLPLTTCYSCLSTAAVNITQICPNGVNATLRHDHCIIRYSDANFFSQRGGVPMAFYYLSNISDTYIDSFVEQREGLLTNLSTTAASTPTRFSFGDSDFTSSKPIYGLVQCTRDLSPGDCELCLNYMISWIPDCCNRSEGVKIFSTTCYLQYEIESFVGNSSGSPMILTPTSPELSPPSLVPTIPRRSSPPPVRTSNTAKNKGTNGTDGGKSVNILLIIVLIIASLILG